MSPLVENTLLMGTLDWDATDGFHLAPARIEACFPNGLRIAQYPDGRQELQGAYSWSQGNMGGVDWKPLPVVLIDEDGNLVNY